MNIFEVLKERLPGYEERPGQLKMAHLISDVIHNESTTNIVLAEGPVGVGKSLAYLFGSLLDLDKGVDGVKERIIVSTSSITLQNQLTGKDLPFVKSVLDRPFSFAALKGITNFCCLRELNKMENILKADNPDVWDMYSNTASTDGEKPDELDYGVWNAISTTHSDCDGKDCKFASQCYYRRRKERANNSDVVVVNHSLLATHLYLGRKFGASAIPEHDVLIIDECHDLEDNIINFLGGTISANALKGLARRTMESREKMMESNFLGAAEKTTLVNMFDSIVPDALRDFNEESFDEMLEVVFSQNKDGKLIMKPYPTKHLVEDAKRILYSLHQVVDRADELFSVSNIGAVSRAANGWEELSEHLTWMEELPKHVAIWAENESIKLRPVNVNEFLEPYWDNPLKKFILTSATVTVNQDFDYIKDRLGINCATVEGIFESPFDYSTQVSGLIIPADLNPKGSDFNERVVESVCTIIDKSPYPKTLVLCTSYAQMNAIVPEVRMRYSDTHLVLEQNKSMSKDFILKKFNEIDQGILVAQAASFGQGVDIKGDKNIIIVKLSFEVPNDPVFKTKENLLESRGGRGFMDLNVPIAALRVRQQVGRGIRSKEDRAFIAILDGRIVRSGWGSVIVNSLPKMRTYKKI